MSRARCEYCGGDVEAAAYGSRICNADRGPNDDGPAFFSHYALPASFDRVPCNICGDEMTLDTRRRRLLADGAGWDGAVCADCTGDDGHAKLAAMRDAGDVVADAEGRRTADHPANADRYRR